MSEGTTRSTRQIDQGRRRFVLEAIDPVTGCIATHAAFSVADVKELCGIVEPDATEIGEGSTYELSPEALQLLKDRFEVSFEPGSLSVQLRSWCPLDDLPYKIHTGRELALMLRGEKPLAVFSHRHDVGGEEIPERFFAPHVEAGAIVKREHFFPPREDQTRGGTRMVLYALPTEEWRIEAYLLLQRTAAEAGWSEGFERMQGSLLGYQDWQNDIFIEKIYQPALQRNRG